MGRKSKYEIDAVMVKEEVKISRKLRRVTEALGGVLLSLTNNMVKNNFADEEEAAGESMLILMNNMNKYLTTKGKMITKGKAPAQVMQYIINLVRWSVREHKTFVWRDAQRTLKGRKPAIIYTDDMDQYEEEMWEEDIFDIAIDYKEQLEAEEKFN